MDDDEADFREFVTLRWSSLVTTAYLITTDRGIAEDCVQEATAHLAATVFRSPEGVALVGFSERDVKYKATSRRRDQWAYAIAKQPIGDPNTFMIALSARADSNAGYVVLTPVGATSARIGNVTGAKCLPVLTG